MADAVIGALRVVLGADTAAFSKGLKDSDSSLSSFGKSAAVAGAAIGVALAGAATAVGVAVGRTLTAMGDMSDAAQKIGVPVEELTKLKYAADLSGVSFETLSAGIVKLSKGMVEMASKGTGPAAEAFKALGISVTNNDGTLKTSSEVIAAVAGKLSMMEDGARKTALSSQIFGKAAGPDLIPLLNEGTAGINAMMQEAEDLGLVFDTKTAKAAEAFGDNLSRLGSVWDGLIVQIAAAVAGPLKELTDKFVAIAKDGELAKNVAAAMASIMQGTADAAAALARNLDGLITTYSGLAAVIITARALITRNDQDFQSAWQAITNFWDRLKDVTQAETDNIAAMQTLGAQMTTGTGIATTFAAGLLQAKTSLDAATGGINTFSASVAASSGVVNTFSADLIAMSGTHLPAMKTGTDVVIESQQKLSAEAKAAADAFRDQQEVMQEGVNVYEGTRTAAEALELKQIDLKKLYDEGAISADTYARAMEDAAERAGTTWDQAGASIAGSFATIAGSFGKESSAMATAAKAFAIAQAVMSVYTGMAKALELPFPANLVAVAAVAAQGFAFVASIKSQEIPKFAEGGSFTMGGSGGIDSQFAGMQLSPGERVDVHKPDLSGGGQLVIKIPTVSPRDFVRGEMLNAVLAGLVEAQRDGAKLVLA